MKARTNISVKTKQTLTLSGFRGVDFSSSEREVSLSRSPKMRNFINEFGANRKRSGWNELFKLDGRINGMFEFVDDGHHVLIIYCGTKFYRVFYDWQTKQYNFDNIYPLDVSQDNNYPLRDQRIQVFFNNNRAYIIGCGDYLVYGNFDTEVGLPYCLKRVVDIAYVPTTTISIDERSVVGDRRATLEDANCLTFWRKNTLVGTWGNVESVFVLDSPIDLDAEVKVEIERLVKNENGEGTREESYNINFSKDATEYNFNTKRFDTDSTNNEDGTNDEETNDEKVPLCCLDRNKGTITFRNFDTTPPIEGKDNITVTFKARGSWDENRDAIRKMRFGTCFGVDGASDQLFLSGNKKYKNVDYHSEPNDFSYFSDLSIQTVGAPNTAITGYGRVSDSTQVIYKASGFREPTVYYRTGYIKTTYDDSNNIDTMRAIFSIKEGNIGEGCVGPYACAEFAGDTIMLSQNGVYGIVLTNNVATAERYARERSRTINASLAAHKNLSEAVGIVYKDKYYLAIDNVCYVADSRFKTYAADSLDNAYNYEWWYWDNIPARILCVINDELYFGTEDGSVCVFDGKYSDRSHLHSKAGELSLDQSTGTITYSDRFKLENGAKALVKSEIWGEVTANATAVENSEAEINVGDENTLMSLGETVLINGKRYTVCWIDTVNCTFSVTEYDSYYDNTEDYEDVWLSEIFGDNIPSSFSIYRQLKGETLYVTELDEEKCQFKLAKTEKTENGEPMGLALAADNQEDDVEICFTTSDMARNVVAEWYTPLLDLGTIEMSKTLLRMSISVDAEPGGEVKFGYDTRCRSVVQKVRGTEVFRFDTANIGNDFSLFSFGTGFANSYTVKCNERNFNFIQFKFISDCDRDCCINSFSIIYKINKHNIGVM